MPLAEEKRESAFCLRLLVESTALPHAVLSSCLDDSPFLLPELGPFPKVFTCTMAMSSRMSACRGRILDLLMEVVRPALHCHHHRATTALPVSCQRHCLSSHASHAAQCHAPP